VIASGELLDKYGIWNDDLKAYERDADGNFVLTDDTILDGWSFYMKYSTMPVPIKNLLTGAGQRASAEERLNNK
jgi:hypothetical protein